jgi:hypothetical protein
MTAMQEYMVTRGTGKIPARLPVDRTRIVPGPPPSAAPLPDAAAAFRRALQHPVGMPPLQELVGAGAKDTIAIQDGRVPNQERFIEKGVTEPWRISISRRRTYTRSH